MLKRIVTYLVVALAISGAIWADDSYQVLQVNQNSITDGEPGVSVSLTVPSPSVGLPTTMVLPSTLMTMTYFPNALLSPNIGVTSYLPLVGGTGNSYTVVVSHYEVTVSSNDPDPVLPGVGGLTPQTPMVGSFNPPSARALLNNLGSGNVGADPLIPIANP